MYETTDVYEHGHMYVQTLRTVYVRSPLPNCKTGLGFIFVVWKQGSVLLKPTSAKNRPTHLALIKTAWLYSCNCSDLQASGKSREKENTDVCTLYTHTDLRAHTHTHIWIKGQIALSITVENVFCEKKEQLIWQWPPPWWITARRINRKEELRWSGGTFCHPTVHSNI